MEAPFPTVLRKTMSTRKSLRRGRSTTYQKHEGSRTPVRGPAPEPFWSRHPLLDTGRLGAAFSVFWKFYCLWLTRFALFLIKYFALLDLSPTHVITVQKSTRLVQICLRFLSGFCFWNALPILIQEHIRVKTLQAALRKTYVGTPETCCTSETLHGLSKWSSEQVWAYPPPGPRSPGWGYPQRVWRVPLKQTSIQNLQNLHSHFSLFSI